MPVKLDQSATLTHDYFIIYFGWKNMMKGKRKEGNKRRKKRGGKMGTRGGKSIRGGIMTESDS